MRFLKFFSAFVITIVISQMANAQYVQPMRYPNYSFTEQVNIGNGTVRVTAPSAYLEIGPASGANKGVLFPRLTTTNRDAIASPATGLVIFNTTENKLQFYNGSNWSNINAGAGSGSGITQLGNTGWGLTRLNDSTYMVDSIKVLTKYQHEKTRDSLSQIINDSWKKTGTGGTNPVTNYVGTTDLVDLSVRTNGVERIRVKTNKNVHIKDTARLQTLGTIPSDSADFELVIFPDIQNMIRYNQSYSRSMFKWLADSAAARNVKAMLQVGDITDWNTLAEWDTLNSQLSLFTPTGIPYMFVPGNHDYGNGFNPAGRDATRYNANLGVAHYTGKPWYGGHYGSSNENFWIQFNASGRKYIAVGLEFLPRDSVLIWAENIIDSFYTADPTAEVIIVTHAYQTMFGELATDTSYYSGNTYGMSADNSGYELWNKLIRKKANIKWVFSGHFIIPNGYAGSGLTDKLIVTGDNGNIINQIFINYQDDLNFGDGYFLRLKFKPSKGTVDAKFYSAYYNAYDSRVASYTLDDPAIAVKTSMGVSGNMTVNKDLRVGGELKVDSLHKGGVPYVFEDHIIKDDTNFRYIPRNYFGGDSLTVGKILFRKYTQKNTPIWYVNDSLGNRIVELRSQYKDGISSLFFGVGAGAKWDASRTDIYLESAMGIGNFNLANLDSGFAVSGFGDRGFFSARNIQFATGFGRAVGYSVLRGTDFDLFGNSTAATATEINRSVIMGSDGAALITGKIEGATVIGVGAARQGAKVDSAVIYGRGAARNSTSAKRSVIAGFEAGQNQSNLDDMLWIHNSNSTAPLISGHFINRWFKVDGRFDLTGDANFTGTGATKLQSGNTAQRPPSAAGLIRFNTDSAGFEFNDGSIWAMFGTGSGGGLNPYPVSFAKNATRDSSVLTLSDGSKFAVKDSTGGASGLTIGSTDIYSSTSRAILYDSASKLKSRSDFSVFSTGEVGIGYTSAQGYRLSVNGSILSASIVTTGTATFISGLFTSGGFSTYHANSEGADIYVRGGNTASTTTRSEVLLGGASRTGNRVSFRGSANYTLLANDSYGGVILGKELQTEASSGTHALYAKLAIRQDSVVNGSASTTHATSLYIQGPPTTNGSFGTSTSAYIQTGDVLLGSGILTATGGLKTGDPGSGASVVKLGKIITTSGLVLSTTRYMELIVDGATVWVALVDPPMPFPSPKP